MSLFCAMAESKFNRFSEKTELIGLSIKGSQFKQPLLEYSGSCAGCAETSYARLITQLFGERMYISNATGCSSIWGGSAPATPYTVNKESGHGVAWANSLFEDNAEHGLGMHLAQKTIRNRLIAKVEEMMASDKASDEFKAAAKAYLDTKDDGKANGKADGKAVDVTNLPTAPAAATYTFKKATSGIMMIGDGMSAVHFAAAVDTGVIKEFEKTPYAARLKATGVIVSCICPLMYMNNPLCKAMPVMTSSNKLRTYTTARFYTEDEILVKITKGGK